MNDENVIQQLFRRVEALEKEVFKPCVYEAREYPGPLPAVLHGSGYTISGTWCQTHGWNCPNRPLEERRRAP